MSFFGFFYDCALHLYLLGVALPKICFQWKKYRGTLLQRLGYRFPMINKEGRPLIWMHAVSLGETKAILPLLAQLKRHPLAPLILLSTSTKTGYEAGAQSGADWHIYLPFDLPYVMTPLVRRVAPDLVILAETDFWYHFLHAAKSGGARLALVNGKLSDRSFRRYRQLPFLVSALLRPFDRLCVQGAVYAERLRQLTIAEDKIILTGNIKFDAEVKSVRPLTREQLGLTSEHYLITLGSTHAPEERIWIHTLKELWKMYPQVRVLMVPRHPERFDQVADLLQQEGIFYARWSDQQTFQECAVLLVDQMGLLLSCYQAADLTFVGGSFTPGVGGHNIIEPALFGKAVLFGPYLHAQPHLLTLVLSHQAGIQVTPSDLEAVVRRCMADPLLTKKMGENGLQLLSEARGALNKTLESIQCLLEKSASC